jgi:signal transduction histidine kinase
MRASASQPQKQLPAWLGRVAAFLDRSSRSTILLLSAFLLLLVGVLDYFTTVELSFLTLYWIPVALATWYAGRRNGYFMAGLSVAAAIGTDLAGGVARWHWLFLSWDLFTRLLSSALFVWMLAKLKQLYQEAQSVTLLQIELRASQASYRELKNFSYIISHNLRAPLRSIEGYSRIVLDRYTSTLDPQGQELLLRLNRSTHQMQRLIDALIDLIEFSGGDLRREDVDLSAIAHSIGVRLKKNDPNRVVDFNVQAGVHVPGDSQLLQMALDCLLENAWKFTAKKSHAAVTFGMLPSQGPPIYFVRDNGVGFEMDYVKGLFTPFHTIHKPGEFPGLGIGLPIAERIIRRHHGRIWAEGSPGDGATFFFTLGEGP